MDNREKTFYAIGSDEPVLNGAGKDLRRVYMVGYEVGGVNHYMNIVACFLNDAYTTFERITGRPVPEIHFITSRELLSHELQQVQECDATKPPNDLMPGNQNLKMK